MNPHIRSIEKCLRYNSTEEVEGEGGTAAFSEEEEDEDFLIGGLLKGPQLQFPLHKKPYGVNHDTLPSLFETYGNFLGEPHDLLDLRIETPTYPNANYSNYNEAISLKVIENVIEEMNKTVLRKSGSGLDRLASIASYQKSQSNEFRQLNYCEFLSTSWKLAKCYHILDLMQPKYDVCLIRITKAGLPVLEKINIDVETAVIWLTPITLKELPMLKKSKALPITIRIAEISDLEGGHNGRNFVNYFDKMPNDSVIPNRDLCFSFLHKKSSNVLAFIVADLALRNEILFLLKLLKALIS